MDEFKVEMEELKRDFLARHQKMEKESNERMKKSIEQNEQQGTTMMPSVPIMANMESGILNNQVAHSTSNGNIFLYMSF
jgi:hypothetical protein